MGWQLIEPRRGVRASKVVAVTISARMDGSKLLKLNVTIPGAIAAQMGWAKKQKVQVEQDDETHMVRISRADHARTYALHGTASGGTVALRFPLIWDIHGDARKPDRAAHVVEGGALLVHLPDWCRRDARPEPRRAIPLVEAPPPAKPKPGTPEFAAKVREGMQRAAAERAAQAAQTRILVTPPADERERHALELLRSRLSTDQVVRETGLSPRDVVRLSEQVRAERAGRAA